MADTTEDLAARAVAGDVAAFATLIARHRPRLAAFCRTLAGAPDGADDLYQETVLRAFQSLDRLASPASFGPWLLGIAANLSKWWARGASRAPYSLDVLTAGGLDPPLAADTQPEYALERAEHAGELLSAIAALPVALRQPLVLHYVEDLSYAEIAAALTLPLSTVKGRLYKARARLRASLPHPTGVSSMTTAPAPHDTVPQQAAAFVDGIHRQLAEWHSAAPPQPFDDAATRVLAAAEARARDFKHGYFGTEHLLLGLLDVDGLAANVLTQLEITREKAADLLLFAVGPGQKPSPDTLVIVPRATTVLERAVDEARRLASPTIGAIHLLLGLLSVRTGIGSLMLESHGLTYEAVRRQLAQLNADTPAAQSPAIPPDLRSNPVVRWAMSLLPPGRQEDLLLRSPIVRGLTLAQALTLLSVGKPRLFDAGEALVAQGQPNAAAHVLLRGRVGIEKSGAIPDPNRPVTYPVPMSAHLGLIVFGASHLIRDAQPASHTATALEISETLTITRDAFADLSPAHPDLVATVTRNIEQSLAPS